MKLPLLFPATLIAALLFMGWKAQAWNFSAKLFPLSLVGVGVVLLSVHIARELWKSFAHSEPRAGTQSMDIGMGEGEDPSVVRWRSVEIWIWLLGFLITILTLGMLISIPLFSFLYLRLHARENWWVSIIIPVLVASFMYGLFDLILHTAWIEGWLWELIWTE